jgi:hypothetical protein
MTAHTVFHKITGAEFFCQLVLLVKTFLYIIILLRKISGVNIEEEED